MWIVILEWFALITDPQALGWRCHGTEVSGPHRQVGEGEGQGAGPENWLNNEKFHYQNFESSLFLVY